MSDTPNCELCGLPMPPGETMFKFHGYSGPCPGPHLKPPPTSDEMMTEDEVRRIVNEEMAKRRNRRRRSSDKPHRFDMNTPIGPGPYRPSPRCGIGLDYGKCYRCPERRKTP